MKNHVASEFTLKPNVSQQINKNPKNASSSSSWRSILWAIMWIIQPSVSHNLLQASQLFNGAFKWSLTMSYVPYLWCDVVNEWHNVDQWNVTRRCKHWKSAINSDVLVSGLIMLLMKEVSRHIEVMDVFRYLHGQIHQCQWNEIFACTLWEIMTWVLMLSFCFWHFQVWL